MMNCPVCGYDGYSAGKCPSCGSDATNLLRLSELPDIYYNKAVELIEQDQLKEAEEVLTTVIGLNPNDVDALVLLGNVSGEVGNYERAIGFWNRALKLDETRTEEIEGNIERAEIFQKGKVPEEKEDLVESLRKVIREETRKGGIRWYTYAGAIVLGLVIILGFYFSLRVFISPLKTDVREEVAVVLEPLRKNIRTEVSVALDPLRKELRDIVSVALEPKPEKIKKTPVESEVRKILTKCSISNILVKEKDGVIYLSGKVRTLWDKNELEKTTEKVQGVRRVDIRGIDVTYPRGYYYQIKENDSLWLIAARLLGDGSRFEEICGANKEIVRDPSSISPGKRILIPE